MKTEYPCLIKKKVADLTPADYNPRTITDEAIGRLTKSLAELGNLQPITWNVRTGRIVGGHQRLKCYQAMGKKEVEVWAVDLSEDKEKAANLALNKLAGEFDPLRLKDLVEQLDTGGIDLEITGFSLDELGDMMSMAPQEISEDDVPEPPADPITKPGDLWLLGQHRLLCGDSTKKQDVARLMNGEKADMVFTDPPYGMNLDTDYTKMAKTKIKSKTYDKVMGDDIDYDASKIFELFPDCSEVFLWGADWYYKTLPMYGSWIVWDKRNEASDGLTGNHFEMLWSKQRHRRRIIRHLWSGFTARNEDTKRVHPTEKPVKVLVDVIDDYSEDGSCVVDIFLGSGSTLIASEKTSRKCYGMEISPNYCDVIVKRWENLTGKKAVLAK